MKNPASDSSSWKSFSNSAVPGQQRASRDVARVVRIAKLGFEIRPEQPTASSCCGREGVGKHEMAMALREFLYGSSQKMVEST